MTNAADLAHQLTQARNELNNLRKTIRGLQAEHRKDVSRLKEVVARTHTCTLAPESPRTPHQPATPPATTLCHDWREIGHIKSWFRTKNGTPRQGSVSSLTRGVLRLAPHTFSNPHHALQGLQEFSHVWILFVFDKNEESGKGHRRSKVAPPRLGGQRVGVFGTRSPHRPNPLGLTLARLDKVEGDCLHLSGLDILDGTPVLDIKPYILQYDSPPVVASHFTNHQTVPVPAKLDDADSLSHGNCLTSEKYSHDLNKENQPCGDVLRLQTHAEKIVCSDSDVLFSSQTLVKHNVRLGTLSGKPATSQDPERTEREVLLSESSEHIDLSSEGRRENNGERETRVPGHMKELAVYTEGEEGNEDQNKVLMKESERCLEDQKGIERRNKVLEELERCTEGEEGLEEQNQVLIKESAQMLIKESAGCTEGEEGIEDQNKVLMAPWIAAPPTASLQVLFNPIAEQQLQAFSHQAENGKYRLEYLSGGEELREAITSVMQQDPRSVYRRTKCLSLLYYFSVDTAHITAWFEGSCVEVLRVQPLTTQSSMPLQESSSSSLAPSLCSK